jgi:beta-xylosidase
VTELWRDPTAPVDARVADLVARMTVEEKVAQLTSIWWLEPDAGGMAPMLSESVGPMPPWDDVVAGGLGQLTRTFGTSPLTAADGLRILGERQRDVVAGNRFGIPAQAHEEVLTGLGAWGATIYPAPLSWAASFDPALVERMASRIAATLGRLGVHQGLAPVLDVVRDHRWGRVEETLGLLGVAGRAQPGTGLDGLA